MLAAVSACLWLFLFVFGVIGPVVWLTLYTFNGESWKANGERALPALICVFAIGTVRVIARVARRGVVVTAHGLVLRGVLRDRPIQWGDIQLIEIARADGDVWVDTIRLHIAGRSKAITLPCGWTNGVDDVVGELRDAMNGRSPAPLDEFWRGPP